MVPEVDGQSSRQKIYLPLWCAIKGLWLEPVPDLQLTVQSAQYPEVFLTMLCAVLVNPNNYLDSFKF